MSTFVSTSDTDKITSRWRNHSGTFFTSFWLILATVAIGLGWLQRDEGYLSAASGTGYWLGIGGGSAMLLLLTYSLRKRWRLLARLLPLKLWFQLHMTLGIVGPLCILFHSNYHLGSLNSTLALVCMLLVAGSGVIGRFIYTRIHFGLYGERIRLREAQNDLQLLRQELTGLAETPAQQSQYEAVVNNIQQLLMAGQQSSLSYWRQKRSANQLYRQLQTLLASHSLDSAVGQLQSRLIADQQALLAILRKLPGLRLFERLFSLWHVVHIPIFVLMLLTAAIHVYIVHAY
ncbi:hypothetical protein [Halioxenophilus sp. WMMB6]|uniref:hypothetical protein n=1 Tax=Halioxenophilus sp. WMMB6 TaxID=3073815 RepID=UPI00295ED3B9|nr:hypothetical protein [Halioxenophilus sp. WMMB6]